MAVHVLATPYQSAGEKSHIKNWLNKTIGLRIDKVNAGDDGATTSLAVTVFTAEDFAGLGEGETATGESARIESVRILGQVASAGVAQGDTLVVSVVPLGKRGQVLAPPPDKDKDAATIAAALS